MSIECPVCGYENNPPDAEFCETCGAELGSTSAPTIEPDTTPAPAPPSIPPTPAPVVTPPASTAPSPPTMTPPPTPTIPSPAPPTPPTPPTPSVQPPVSPPSAIPSPAVSTPPTGASATARLVAKLPNAPVAEFPINSGALVGIFTPESGPVDIDLEQFPGNETISKQHAEILYENGGWIIKDSSTNGTYIKPVGQTRFGARIMAPTPLHSGDEIAFAKVVFVFQSP